MDFERIKLVARREWWTRLRQRSFQVTTIVQILFVVIGACLPVIIAGFDDDDGPTASKVLVLDDTGAHVAERLAPYLAGGGVETGVDVIALEQSVLAPDEARAQVDDGDADGALVVTRDANEDLAFTFVNQSGDSTATSQRVYAAAASVALQDRLERGGIDQAEFQQATAPPAFSVEGTETATTGDADEIGGVEIALAYFFTIVMFMAIMLYGTWVAQGVVEEKSSRIMEIMINAATPRDLLAGKVLGIGAAGLTQLLPMLLAGGIVFALQKPIARALEIDTASLPDLDFGAVSIAVVGWFLVYFLLGFILYAAMYAALGSMVSRQEEVNQAVSPMMTVMFVGYFAAFFTMYAPESMLSRVLSIFPLTSPFVMISRVIVGDPPAWEMVLSVGLLAVTLVAAVLVAARMYRIGVLLYGQKPSLRAVFSRDLAQTAR
ncbi:MAG: ABC transporter permease [Chloroflexota bacterium]|nr:ABC transporter permease [Chloroflexota bacterium]